MIGAKTFKNCQNYICKCINTIILRHIQLKNALCLLLSRFGLGLVMVVIKPSPFHGLIILWFLFITNVMALSRSTVNVANLISL